jgi:hypothetical protein
MFVVVAGFWLASTPSQANWLAPSPAIESGVILTQGAGTKPPKCKKGEVFDTKAQKCVPAKQK